MVYDIFRRLDREPSAQARIDTGEGFSASAKFFTRGLLGVMLLATSAGVFAREVTIKVDARSPPWVSRSNPKKMFGSGEARAPVVVWALGKLFPGSTLRFKATGQTSTGMGMRHTGPEGYSDYLLDHGVAYFPSHYIKSKVPIGMNALVGCFVGSDGVVVGRPFFIGREAEAEVPEGAVALSLGINDDRFFDNVGALQVTINKPEPKVIVEDDPSNYQEDPKP